LPNQNQFANNNFGPGNQASAGAQSFVRQRSHEEIEKSLDNFLKMMEIQFRDKHHGKNLDGSCEDRFFCEYALKGSKKNAEQLNRMLYHVALETPNSQAKKSGLDEIFTAIKRQNCNVFKCIEIK
jgi:hypothetical protein